MFAANLQFSLFLILVYYHPICFLWSGCVQHYGNPTYFPSIIIETTPLPSQTIILPSPDEPQTEPGKYTILYFIFEVSVCRITVWSLLDIRSPDFITVPCLWWVSLPVWWTTSPSVINNLSNGSIAYFFIIMLKNTSQLFVKCLFQEIGMFLRKSVSISKHRHP
jgi:hypothetical protein